MKWNRLRTAGGSARTGKRAHDSAVLAPRSRERITLLFRLAAAAPIEAWWAAYVVLFALILVTIFG